MGVKFYPTPDQPGVHLFECPGCDMTHVIYSAPYEGPHPTWTWNGDAERPTFSPSLLVRYPRHEPPVTTQNAEEYRRNPWPQTRVEHVCHSFIRDGRIEYLADCTHAMAGQTIDLPDIYD